MAIDTADTTITHVWGDESMVLRRNATVLRATVRVLRRNATMLRRAIERSNLTISQNASAK